MVIVIASTIGAFALAAGTASLSAGAALQQSGCWNSVWGTDNDGHFFSILAADGCPEFRGRVFAGAVQQGPTVRSVGGKAKMTGVDACQFDTVEVKAVGRANEVVFYRFKWTADQLGCESDPSGPSTRPPSAAPRFVANPSRYSPFPGALLTAAKAGNECRLTVSGAGNRDLDVSLNGIRKLSNGTVTARPFFSLWVAPEGGDRWTARAFHAASLTADCTVEVFRTTDDPAPTQTPAVRSPSLAPTLRPATTTTTTAARSTTAAAAGATISVQIESRTVQIQPCGRDTQGRQLVCIRDSRGEWINVDSIEGFGEFERMDGNTVVYALNGNELRARIHTIETTEPVLVNVFVGPG